MFNRTRTRVVATVATIALLGGAGFLALTPAAQAASACVSGKPSVTCVGSLASTSATTIFPGGNGQKGGDWTTGPLEAVGTSTNAETWSMFIMLDDITPAVPPGLIPLLQPGSPAACKAASQSIGFAGTPTVTNTTAGNTATFTARLVSSSVCTTIKDILEIDSTHAGAAGAVLNISGIAYNVGSGVAYGPVKYKVNNVTEDGNAASFTTAVSDALVSNVGAASTNPATLVPPTLHTPFNPNPVPDVIVAEKQAGALGASGVCVALVNPPTGTSFGTTPSVISNGGPGKGTPGPVTMTPGNLSFGFTVTQSVTPPPVDTPYTITGLSLITGSGQGPVDANVTAGPCTAPGGAYTTGARLATVGLVQRIGGSNRYATAASIADATSGFANLAGRTVVIARGDNFPDALAASYLAGKNQVPIFLTTPSSVPAETIASLREHGVTDVVLVGGTTSITPAVADFISALPTYAASTDFTGPATGGTITVTRVGGADRYDTAKAVAEQAGLNGAGTVGIQNGTSCSAQKTAILASGENFPDALAAGGLAFGGVRGCGSGPLPLLLTPKNGLTQSTVSAITDLGIKQIILMGGEQSVIPAVKSALETLPGVTVTRVAGAARQDTAIALANTILGPATIGKWTGGGFLVATPGTFPDALVAASLSGSALAPLYLAASPSSFGPTNVQAITDYPNNYTLGALLGGTSSLTDDVFASVVTAIASQPG